MLEKLNQWDQNLFIWVNQKYAFSWLDEPMIWFSSTWLFVPLYIWGIYMLIKKWKSKSWIPISLLLLAFGLADSISTRVLKDNTHRLRPCFNQELSDQVRLPDGLPGGKYGFVSSHSANAFAVYPLLMLFVFARKTSPENPIKGSKKWNKQQKLGYWIMFVVACFVAYSRVYLGRHFVGDVLGGAILGLLLGRILWNWFNRNSSKWMIEK